jgi:hypothetical protein
LVPSLEKAGGNAVKLRMYNLPAPAGEWWSVRVTVTDGKAVLFARGATNAPDATWVQFKVGAGVVGIPANIVVKTKQAGTSVFKVDWLLMDQNGAVASPPNATPLQQSQMAGHRNQDVDLVVP